MVMMIVRRHPWLFLPLGALSLFALVMGLALLLGR
jgi:hypothetical protein